MTSQRHLAPASPSHVPGPTPSLADFQDRAGPDLFGKCHAFDGFVSQVAALGIYQSQYRVVLQGPLDHRICVLDPFTGREREMICFDSNSYLGLHLHPCVTAAVRDALDTFGYGTPSAQLLGGTNRHLCALEEAVAAFYGREEAIVFSSGYAANVGTLTALLRPGDVVVRDRFSHASVQDGSRWSGAESLAYAHSDADDLARQLARGRTPGRGALVVSDGVFSMHGDLAPLPELRDQATRQGARLMIDEAHALGVIGPTGCGLEEHYGMSGAIDIVMGTFSKAPGSVGGYVTGSRALIRYLRFFARSAMFTASLPAATCAGITAAMQVMQDEPEHRERLWRNTRRFWSLLADAGLDVAPLASPIVAVTVGHEALLWQVGRALYDAGIKCGSVGYPAVPRGEGIVRLSVNARHTDADLDAAAAAIVAIARRLGLPGRSVAERAEIGVRLAKAVTP